MSTPVVLITGALSGIGRATALAFAKEGAHVVISGRKEDAGRALLNELHELGAEAEFVRADVRREADVKTLVDRTIDRFGRLDAAVNNAGTEGQAGPITDQTPESYAATFDTNVLGVLLSLKHELRVMVPQGRGSIINVSSVAGQVALAGTSVYTASKHAVEVAESGVRVNSVAPGPIETPMLERFAGTPERKAYVVSHVPAGRLGSADEVAQTIVFVASDKAPYLTGASLVVDGGVLASA